MSTKWEMFNDFLAEDNDFIFLSSMLILASFRMSLFKKCNSRQLTQLNATQHVGVYPLSKTFLFMSGGASFL